MGIWTEIYRKITYIICIKSFSSEGNYKPIDGVVLEVMSDKLKSGYGNNNSFKEARGNKTDVIIVTDLHSINVRSTKVGFVVG